MSRVEIGSDIHDPRREAADRMETEKKAASKYNSEKVRMIYEVKADVPKDRNYSAELQETLDKMTGEPILHETLLSLSDEKLSELDSNFGNKGLLLNHLLDAPNMHNITELIKQFGAESDIVKSKELAKEIVKASQS